MNELEHDVTAAIKTYRYLRIGMVAAVVAIFAAVLHEYARDGQNCLQGSISSYYHTPARPIFVAGLFVISFGLIAIKGKGIEDMALNMAGVLAPIVAVIPTTDVGSCRTQLPDPYPAICKGSSCRPEGTAWVPERIKEFCPSEDCRRALAQFVRDDVDNNIDALMWAGIFALLVAGVVILVEKRFSNTTVVDVGFIDLVIYGFMVVAVAIIFWFAQTSEGFVDRAHAPAAIAMFVFLGIAIVTTAIHDRREFPNYARAYVAIAGAMILTAGVAIAVRERSEHEVFWLEAFEIVWFALFWTLQTFQHWRHFGTSNTPAPRTAAATTASP